MLGKGVGDTVIIDDSHIKKQYMITCVIQCISEMGNVICLSKDAYRRLDPDFKFYSECIQLKNSTEIKHVLSVLKKRYSKHANGFDFADISNSFSSVFTTVQSATGFASNIVLILTFLLIGCITILLSSITIYREVTETGIFKALGFQSIELRLQFTFRFLLVSCIGGVAAVTAFFCSIKINKITPSTLITE